MYLKQDKRKHPLSEFMTENHIVLDSKFKGYLLDHWTHYLNLELKSSIDLQKGIYSNRNARKQMIIKTSLEKNQFWHQYNKSALEWTRHLKKVFEIITIF